MKKIFALLISLLFFVGTFGVGAIMATIDCCDPDNFNISKTSVRVGDTFILTVNDWCLFCLEGAGFRNPCDVQIVWSTIINGPPDFPYPSGSPIETIDVENVGDNYKITLRAVRPGTLVFKNINCDNEETVVTISPKSLPMLKFMKMLGLDKKK